MEVQFSRLESEIAGQHDLFASMNNNIAELAIPHRAASAETQSVKKKLFNGNHDACIN
jgi:hypothetical protein